jgi:hypothetical protein
MKLAILAALIAGTATSAQAFTRFASLTEPFNQVSNSCSVFSNTGIALA